MRVLVIGGGGREHALVWKLAQSPRVGKIICAPGNAGIAALAETAPVGSEDLPGLLQMARQAEVDLTLVGPEVPLVSGVVDRFQEAGLKIFGPTAGAAEIEGSKSFAKELMRKYRIPTADYRIFDRPEPAYQYIRSLGRPCVVKANGLAAGKGVTVAPDSATACEAVRLAMEERVFGEAGSSLVIEELLEGEEVSILAFSDGETVVPMVSAQDHKRVFDWDKGPNTGGMGAYSPAPVYTPEVHHRVTEEILKPVISALREEGREYVGVIYAGLMITAEGPKVLEFNARFGDPETQVVLPLLKTDLVEIIEAVLERRLHQQPVEWLPGAAVCVVLASQGYPGAYAKGFPISGLENLLPNTMVFHAGTDRCGDQIVTAGGRVLGVTARGADIRSAIDLAYQAVERISFHGCHYRRDIGYRALQYQP
ncbi:MAG: phosphoribosylamine--glycine ligase [Syntrophomonadaceae bacterium]|nr:phosphoribosylamine--glycine ligase [Syntrophomonadaceae bacterium]